MLLSKLVTGRKTLANEEKKSSLKKKEPVAGTYCLEATIYIVLRFLDEKFI